MARRHAVAPVAETISAGGQEVHIDGVPQRQRVISAAAMTLDIKDRKIVRRLKSYRQDWQAEAWGYYRTTPLVGFGSDFIANAMSRLRFHIAWQSSVAEMPAEVEPDNLPPEMDQSVFETAMAILTRLDRGQGLMEMARKGAYGLTLPGEVIVLGREEIDQLGHRTERFDAFSTSEIDLSKADKGVISIKTSAQGLGVNEPDVFNIDPEKAVFFRVWRPDPEFGHLAATPMQRVLEQCEEQGLLRRYMRGASRSRLNAGLLEVPSEWGLGPQANQRDNGEMYDKLADDLVTALMTAIGDEGSAATVVPYVVHAPMETLGKARHITFAREFDTLSLEIRRRLDEEIASGLDLPDQVLLGLGDVKFRNAEVITREQFKLHLEPLAIVWCRSLSVGFLYPAMEADGIDPEIARQFTIWYDPAAVTSNPDQSKSSEFGYDRGILSASTWRSVNNYTDEDAPSEEEWAERKAGTPVPIATKPSRGESPIPGPDVAFPAEPAVPLAASGARRHSAQRPMVAKLGRRLAVAESMCRLKVQLAADTSMRRAFERIGAEARSKAGNQAGLMKGIDNAALVYRLGLANVIQLGVNPQHHLDAELAKLRDRYMELVQAHQHKVVGMIAAAGRLPVETLTARSAASWARAVEHSWGELEGRLHKLAGDRLFLAMVASSPGHRPALVAAAVEGETLGEFDVTISVPAGLIRDVLSVAGGTAIPDDRNPDTLGGVAGGPVVDDLLTESGLGSEGYEWMYGDASTRTRPFEPHSDLDGVPFADFGDPVLANVDSFPEGAFYFPGDHAGCVTGDTFVSGPLATCSTLRHYEGELIVLRTASGQYLSITPHHPVLTYRGWVEAGYLVEGDDLVRCVDMERASTLIPHNQQMPSRIEDVAAAFLVTEGVTARSVPVTAKDFHGDGGGSEIAVVATNRNLRDHFYATLDEPSAQQRLTRGPVTAPTLDGEGSEASVRFGLPLAPDGVVGGTGEAGALVGRETTHADGLGLTAGPPDDTKFIEPGADRAAVHAEMLGESLDGIASFVEADKLIEVERLTGWSGHVFTLETGTGWYLADSLVVRNCQCEQSNRIVDRIPAVYDPVSPSSLAERGLTKAPQAEAEWAKSAVPSYTQPYPIPIDRTGQTLTQRMFAADMERIDARGWQLGREWDRHIEGFMQDAFEGASRRTPLESGSISAYQGSGYGPINDSLRGHYPDFEREFRGVSVREHIARLDRVVSEHTLKQDQLFYRGVHEGYGGEHSFENVLAQLNAPGDAFMDRGFVSVSASQDMGETFDGLTVFEIEMPAGSPGLPMPNPTYEGEVLLPRGATFEFVSASEDGKVYRVRYIGINKI